MKRLLFIAFLAIGHIMLGQTDKAQNDNFLVYAGASFHAAYGNFQNVGSTVQLKPILSPGMELGFRYRRTIFPRLYGSLSVGGDIGVIRNKFITEFRTAFRTLNAFQTGQHLIGFWEGGLCYRTGILNGAVQIFGGYRLNMVKRVTFGYHESYVANGSEHTFEIETTVNPNGKLFHAMVLRPEVLVHSKKSGKRFLIGLQGVLGSGSYSNDFVAGTYIFDSMEAKASGRVIGSIAHVSILGQFFL